MNTYIFLVIFLICMIVWYIQTWYFQKQDDTFIFQYAAKQVQQPVKQVQQPVKQVQQPVRPVQQPARRNNTIIKSLQTSNPNPRKSVNVSVGGYNGKALLQWKNSGLQVSNNGRNINASINPSSHDGSKSGASTFRNRNEIALKSNLNKLKTVSFNFSARNTDNIKQHSTGIFFQLKPSGQGGNNAFIRLGIRDGKIAVGYPNKTAQILKDSSGNTFNANGNNNFQLKLNGNSSQLYINGKPVADFKLPASRADSTNIKFGLEAVPGTLNDAISGSYKNIDIN